MIFIYDESAQDLETSLLQLRDHGIGANEVSPFASRLELLKSVATADGPVVILVDLQADDGGGDNYSGHRIIETIRRHPLLALHGRPVAYTAHARPEVITLAQRHGALGIISKTDLDVPDEEITTVGLSDHLKLLSSRTPIDSVEKFSVFPSSDRAIERYSRTASAVQNGLDYVLDPGAQTVEHLRPFFWDLMGYLAEGLEPTSAAHWIVEDDPSSVTTHRQVTNSLDRLRPTVDAQYRTGARVEWTVFARDLLKCVPQQRTVPTTTRALRTIGRVDEMQDQLTVPRLRELGFLDDEAARALDRVLVTERVPRRTGNEALWRHTDDLRTRIAMLESDSGGQAKLMAAFVRGVNNVYATYLEERRRKESDRPDR